MSSLIPINITLGDRSYRLKIQASDEERLRTAVKMLNQKILEFKVSFAGKDMQDYVTMVLLWFVTEDRTGNNRSNTDTENEVNIKLQSLIRQIEKQLDNKK
jgi:cell division protein ZapA